MHICFTSTCNEVAIFLGKVCTVYYVYPVVPGVTVVYTCIILRSVCGCICVYFCLSLLCFVLIYLTNKIPGKVCCYTYPTYDKYYTLHGRLLGVVYYTMCNTPYRITPCNKHSIISALLRGTSRNTKLYALHVVRLIKTEYSLTPHKNNTVSVR